VEKIENAWSLSWLLSGKSPILSLQPEAVHQNASVLKAVLLKPTTTKLAFPQKKRAQYLVLRISIFKGLTY
jgi:hypothetical protein